MLKMYFNSTYKIQIDYNVIWWVLQPEIRKEY